MVGNMGQSQVSLQLQQQEGGTKEMKFHIIKEEESVISPAFDGVKEFESVDSFLAWVSYHRAYITDIRAVEKTK